MPVAAAAVVLPLALTSWKIPPLTPVDLENVVVGRADLVYELVVANEVDVLLTLIVLLTLLLLVLVLVLLVELWLVVLVLVVLMLVDVVEVVVGVDEVVVEELEVVDWATRPLTRAPTELTSSPRPEESSSSSEPEEESESPVLKTMISADPEVTVTTQKLAPPAPDDASSLVTPP